MRSKYEQYEICRERGHQSEVSLGKARVCKFCHTVYLETVHEENVPTKGDKSIKPLDLSIIAT